LVLLLITILVHDNLLVSLAPMLTSRRIARSATIRR
jgi:hypothetical protein